MQVRHDNMPPQFCYTSSFLLIQHDWHLHTSTYRTTRGLLEVSRLSYLILLSLFCFLFFLQKIIPILWEEIKQPLMCLTNGHVSRYLCTYIFLFRINMGEGNVKGVMKRLKIIIAIIGSFLIFEIPIDFSSCRHTVNNRHKKLTWAFTPIPFLKHPGLFLSSTPFPWIEV